MKPLAGDRSTASGSRPNYRPGSRPGYRPEIDGLRAVSVLGVVLFHVGVGVPGGYVGVDVFFVISGFLITQIILNDLETGSFSLKQFWVRRIRRILPAIGVMVAAVLITGALLLDARTLKDLAESAMAQSLISSNLYFQRDAGYFSESAHTKQLLHTWSLAVEEQFYLVLPLALALAHRFWPRRLTLILAAVAALSFSWSLFATDGTQDQRFAAFFLLPSRAWELLAGSLIAATQQRFRVTGWPAEVLSLGGLLAILLAMALYDDSTPFPGNYALLPVAGAAAVIVGNQNQVTLAGRLLSLRPMVFLGLISYSLYLWHWPLVSFANSLLIEVNQTAKLGLVLGSLALATLSWKFVETPFRRSPSLSHPAFVLRSGLVATLVLFSLSAAIWKFGGFPVGTLHQDVELFAEDIFWQDLGFVHKEGFGAEPIGARSRRDALDFVLWGDSHAITVSGVIDRAARKHGAVGQAYLKGRWLPVTEIWRPSWEKTKKSRIRRNRLVLRSILKRRVPNLILVGRWAASCDGRSPLEIADGHSLGESLVMDLEGLDAGALTPESSSKSVARQLQKMLDLLEQSGTRVWLLKQVPETSDFDTARHYYLSQRFPAFNRTERFTTPLRDHLERQKWADSALESLSSPGLTLIDPAPAFFENPRQRLEEYSERSHYRDNHHLTQFGADKFLFELFDRMFAEMSGHARADSED